ncbi:hypothetical protein [Reichenbachiella faecimaris]|nr:hypothetical protein [Reichenbachiella faecimaris]
MKKTILALGLTLLIISMGYSKPGRGSYKTADMTTLGLGVGLTYGGIGGKLTHNFGESLGVMAGLGYNFDGAAYNLGMQFYIPSKTKAQGYVSAMYGTNGVILVEDTYAGNLSNSYQGVSFGFGVNLRSKRTKGNFLELGLIVPVRSSEFNEDWDALKNIPGLDTTDPWPVLINIGYNFRLG